MMQHRKIIYIISSVIMSGLSIGIIVSASATQDQNYCGEPGFDPGYRTIQCPSPSPSPAETPLPSTTPEIDLPNVPMDAGGRDYQPPFLPSTGGGSK